MIRCLTSLTVGCSLTGIINYEFLHRPDSYFDSNHPQGNTLWWRLVVIDLIIVPLRACLIFSKDVQGHFIIVFQKVRLEWRQRHWIDCGWECKIALFQLHWHETERVPAASGSMGIAAILKSWGILNAPLGKHTKDNKYYQDPRAMVWIRPTRRLGDGHRFTN